MIDLQETFAKHSNEYLQFNSVENKLHSRPDICAFILLDKLVPNEGIDMVSAAEHDEIFLDTDCDKLSDVATDEDILTLTRCGVRYDSDMESLAMFV